MYLRLEDWESFVKDIFPKRYGVVWNKYKTYPQGAWESRHKKWTLDDELEPSLPPLKKRQVYGRNMIWRFTRWCAAFQPDISTNMETNNFVESWHNQLKTWYFERRRNRRLDTLIAVLVEDVDYDMQATRQIRSLNIGRMTANERERRKREIRAEAIALPILKDMVDMISSTGGPAPVIHVASFRQADDVAYDIHLQGKIMLSCSCRHFVYRRSPCKHMFAARRVDENLQFRESPGAQGPAVQEVEEPMDTPIAEEGIEEQIEPADFLMDMTNSIKSLADQAGNDRQLQEVVRNGLRRIQGELLQVEGSRGSTLPPNVHFQRQKR